MQIRKMLGTAALAASVALAAASSASAAPSRHGPNLPQFDGSALFVQTDALSGNQIVVYDREPDGGLRQAASYATGGVGGQLAGAAVDFVASQNSLVYDAQQHALLAVNAGSNSISVFSVLGDQLFLREVINSGGSFPVSIAVHGNLVYVLNALNGGEVQGYVLVFDHLIPIPGSGRALGLNPAATPQFTTTPGDVAFTPDGRQLVVTTKANTDDIDVFAVDGFGSLSAAPVVNSEPNEVPFGVGFDAAGHLVVAESAANSAVATFSIAADGTLTQLSQVLTGQAATCWVSVDGSLVFASNAGSADVSTLTDATSGALTLGAATPTDPGTVDSTVSPDGRFLYVQAGGNGNVNAFRIGPGGSLSEIQSVLVPNAVGGEGIAAS